VAEPSSDYTPPGGLIFPIFIAPFEHGEIGPDLFHAACDMGLRILRAYRFGLSP
jgi:hypothetical protein